MGWVDSEDISMSCTEMELSSRYSAKSLCDHTLYLRNYCEFFHKIRCILSLDTCRHSDNGREDEGEKRHEPKIFELYVCEVDLPRRDLHHCGRRTMSDVVYNTPWTIYYSPSMPGCSKAELHVLALKEHL